MDAAVFLSVPLGAVLAVAAGDLAVEDLEGLRGKSYKQRCSQVTRRGEGVIMWIYLVADLAACWFGLAILMLVLMFIPEGQDGAWQRRWKAGIPIDPIGDSGAHPARRWCAA